MAVTKRPRGRPNNAKMPELFRTGTLMRTVLPGHGYTFLQSHAFRNDQAKFQEISQFHIFLLLYSCTRYRNRTQR